MNTTRSLLAISILSLISSERCLGTENWPQWRGPGANGVAAGTEYPVKWTDSENVVWKFPLPGLGASTPALWGDTIIVTGEKGEQPSMVVLIDVVVMENR